MPIKQQAIWSLFCIFSFVSCVSSNQGQMIESNSLIAQINGEEDLLVMDKIITDKLDFSRIDNTFINANGCVNHRVNSNISFVNCVFLKDVCIEDSDRVVHKIIFENNIEFVGCDFRGEVRLDNIDVRGSASFAKSIFREECSLNNMLVIGEKAELYEMKTEKDFQMCNSQIRGCLNMMDSDFGGDVRLTMFDCNKAQMSNIKCNGLFDMSMSKIGNRLMMNYCDFRNGFMLENSYICGKCDFKKTHFSKFKKWQGSIFGGQIDTTGIE